MGDVLPNAERPSGNAGGNVPDRQSDALAAGKDFRRALGVDEDKLAQLVARNPELIEMANDRITMTLAAEMARLPEAEQSPGALRASVRAGRDLYLAVVPNPDAMVAMETICRAPKSEVTMEALGFALLKVFCTPDAISALENVTRAPSPRFAAAVGLVLILALANDPSAMETVYKHAGDWPEGFGKTMRELFESPKFRMGLEFKGETHRSLLEEASVEMDGRIKSGADELGRRGLATGVSPGEMRRLAYIADIPEEKIKAGLSFSDVIDRALAWAASAEFKARLATDKARAGVQQDGSGTGDETAADDGAAGTPESCLLALTAEPIDGDMARDEAADAAVDELKRESPGATDGQLKPSWDKEKCELRFDNAVVRHVKRSAKNIVRILDAFEEEGWPPRIDDPLPPATETRRLSETVRTLNDRLDRIRFQADGSGKGIIWKPLEA